MNPLLASLEEERRRRYRRLVAFSAAIHVLAFFVFVVVPMPRHSASFPSVVQVDLVAGPAPARRAPAHHAAPPAPRPKEVPEPKPAPPPPPPPKQAEVVLPEKPTQKPKPKPPPPKVEKTAKAEPKKPAPKPEPKPEKTEKPQKEISYDALMAQLRKEDHDELPPGPAAQGDQGEATSQRGGGTVVTPEVMAWMRRAKAQVTQSWVLAPGFRTQPLQTEIDVTLSSSGDVVGTKVTQGSGNPWFDQSVERAIQKASPLPPPPGAGDWLFVFRPGDAF